MKALIVRLSLLAGAAVLVLAVSTGCRCIAAAFVHAAIYGDDPDAPEFHCPEDDDDHHHHHHDKRTIRVASHRN